MSHQYIKRHPRFQRTDIVDALIADPTATFASIAEQCNVSRERVRQVAKSWGMANGRTRQKKSRVQSLDEVFTRQCKKWGFVPRLRRLGFKLEPVLTSGTTTTKAVSTRGLLINGLKCEVRPAATSPTTVKHWGPAYIHIHGNRSAAIRRGVKFVIYEVGKPCTVSGWLVLEINRVPKSTTVGRVGPIHPKYVGWHGPEASWPQYLNAWDQLKTVTKCDSCKEVHYSELDCPSPGV